MPADLVLINGKIATVNDRDEFVQAVAVKDGRFLSVGASEQVQQYVGPDTEVVDLGGRAVIPGIVDSHNHVVSAGVLLEGVMLFAARNLEDLRETVAGRVAEKRAGEWILGGGWVESQFSEYRLPTRYDLDPVSPENPVILDRLFGISVVNSKALELAGIDRNTPDPPRGSIDRDPRTGEPTGILRDGAQALVKRLTAAGSVADLQARARHLIEHTCLEYARWGITSVVDPGVSPLTMRAYQQLYEAGRQTLRVNMMPVWHGLYGAMGDDDLDARASTLGVSTGLGDEWLRLGALKMAVDGGLGSRTALMHRPFKDGARSRIPLRLDVEQLDRYFELGLSRGWSIGIHCCGDLAQDLACEAFDRVIGRHAHTAKSAPSNIVHGYLPTPRALEVMADRGIAVSVQPGFIYVEGDIYFDVVDQETLHRFKPLRTYLANGILVAANSDMTSAHYNPFFGMYAAVTRRTAQGRSLGEDECVDRTTMIRLFTRNGALLCGEGRQKGSIEPGKLADLAVLSEDLFTIPSRQILDLEVRMTVIGGKVVHRQGL
jgi:hypothetical protein